MLLAGGSRLIRPASVQSPERHLASLQTMEQFDAPGEYRMKLAILLNIKPSIRHSVCSSGNNLISRGLRIARGFKCKTGEPRQQLRLRPLSLLLLLPALLLFLLLLLLLLQLLLLWLLLPALLSLLLDFLMMVLLLSLLLSLLLL